MKNKFTNLLEVRKLMALLSMLLFIILSLLGRLEVAFIQTVIITIVSFYFGKSMGDNNNKGL